MADPKSKSEAEEIRKDLDHPGKIPGEGGVPTEASGDEGTSGGDADSSTTGGATGGTGGETTDIGGGGDVGGGVQP